MEYVRIKNHYVKDNGKKNLTSIFEVECLDCGVSIGTSRTTIDNYINSKKKMVCKNCTTGRKPLFTNFPFIKPNGFILLNEYNKGEKTKQFQTDEQLLAAANERFQGLNITLLDIQREPRQYKLICPKCKKSFMVADGTIRTWTDESKVMCRNCLYPKSIINGTSLVQPVENLKSFTSLNPDNFFTITEDEGSRNNEQQVLLDSLSIFLKDESFINLLQEKMSNILAERYSEAILKNDGII